MHAEAVGSVGTLTVILQALMFSVIATDRVQSQAWVTATPQHPLAFQHGKVMSYVWETNPILAGRPDQLDSYMDVSAAAVAAVPRMLGPPYAQILLVAGVYLWGSAVRVNNIPSGAGFPSVTMIEWRFGF